MSNIRGTSYYKIVNGNTWEAAESTAQSIGGNLVAINNAEENSWIHNNFSITKKRSENDPEDLDLYWAGLTDKDEEGTWVWSNGDPTSYTNWGSWGSSEPNGGINENYMVLGWHSPQWQDAGSNTPGSYTKGIAEIPLSYFSVSDVTLTEGNSGSITISRTGGSQSSQNISLTSSNGTASSSSDYTALNTTVSFAAGETSKTVTFSSIEDNYTEAADKIISQLNVDFEPENRI